MKEFTVQPLGLYIALFGAAVIGAAYMAGLHLEWINAIGFAIVGMGILIFVVRLAQSLIYGLKNETGVHRDDTAVVASAVIRCMLAMSIVDDHLDDKEVFTIVKIYEKLTGTPITELTVRETAAMMQAEKADLATEMKNAKTVLDRALKEKIVLASLYILAADGVVEPSEAVLLEQIREGLGVSQGTFKAMKEKFLRERNLG